MSDQYAVFGNPIEHSVSPMIHRSFAQQTNQHLTYSKQKIEQDVFEDRVSDFFSSGGCGLNITVPFKERAFEMCDVLSPRARYAGAVNTLLMKDGQLMGDNTDGIGLVRDIQDSCGWTLRNKRLLIIGAGGAARGALLPLLETQPQGVTLTNRTYARAELLQKRLDGHVDDVTVHAVPMEVLGNESIFDVIINTTSAGLLGETLALPAVLCGPNTCCYDMSYDMSANEPSTLFLQWARKCGADQVADGFGMLLEQAAESFSLWRGVLPSTTELRQSMR
ncbi:MAG: shikimate dehydrogenase [Pseudomonadota bacterium]